jgi:Ca2+-binding EF-hand superfamily protein
MFPKRASRFRAGRSVEVQANEGELDQLENDMRDLGSYRMSGNKRALIEPDRTPRRQYGDFPAMPETPKDYTSLKPQPPPQRSPKRNRPRDNASMRGGQSIRGLTRQEREEQAAAVKIQSIGRGKLARKGIASKKIRQEQQQEKYAQEQQFEQQRRKQTKRAFREKRKARERARRGGEGGGGGGGGRAPEDSSLPQLGNSFIQQRADEDDDEQQLQRQQQQQQQQIKIPIEPDDNEEASSARRRRSPSPRKQRARSRMETDVSNTAAALNNPNVDMGAVEQLRLKLKVCCTTHKGLEPAKIFDKWDKDKDGELDREEVLEGMNKLLGKDVLEEWNMFENFFAYIDTDGNGTIDRDEFAEFVTTKPKVRTIRRQSQQFDSPKQVYENFHGTFQGDKHKSGQKAFGSYGGTDGKKKTYYKERTGIDPTRNTIYAGTPKPDAGSALSLDEIDFDAVEQLRLKLKVACTTHKGVEPSRIFDKWDKDGVRNTTCFCCCQFFYVGCLVLLGPKD